MANTCKICGSPSEKIFSKVVLKKYPVDYLKCSHCGFIQTSEPVWIEEAYNSAITSLDIGLIDRNVGFSAQVSLIIDACFPEAKTMLDYAGGYGMFVRLMRDRGYDFFRQDPFCDNLFSKHFDITDIKTSVFDVATAFEVFEHFVNPMEEIAKIFKYSDNVIFSTQLVPLNNNEVENWWYIAPETGQHVAFYTSKAMQIIAEKFGKKYYSKNTSLHVFTSKELSNDQLDYAFKNKKYRHSFYGLKVGKLDFKITRESLLEKDFQYIKGIINS